MALMKALKWAPSWYVSADFPTFISYPDLIQRLAIKGFWDVSPDLSSGGSFQSSQWACSHGTLQNPWEVFSISTVSAALWLLLYYTGVKTFKTRLCPFQPSVDGRLLSLYSILSAPCKGLSELAHRHITWGVFSRVFTGCHWVPGVLESYSISDLFQCV